MTELTRYTSGTRGYISHAHAEAERDTAFFLLVHKLPELRLRDCITQYRLMIDAADAMSAFEDEEHESTRS